MERLGKGENRPARGSLASWPLFHDDAEVVELLDRGFNVATDLGTVLGRGGTLSDGNDPAVAPRRGWDRGNSLRQIRGTQLQFLASRGGGAKHGALTNGAGIGVCHRNTKRDHIRTDRDEWIFPGRRYG